MTYITSDSGLKVCIRSADNQAVATRKKLWGAAHNNNHTLEKTMMFQKTLEKMRKNEGGFTLIELLVVMIIIGILAAIAIPLFLGQKEKARESAVKNDLRNAATFAETFAVDHNGSYVGADELQAYLAAATTGFVESTGVDVTVTEADADSFVLSADHADIDGDVDGIYTSNGTPQLQVPVAAPAED